MSEDRCIIDEMQQAKVDRGGSEIFIRLEMQETVKAACRSTTAAGLGLMTRRGLTNFDVGQQTISTETQYTQTQRPDPFLRLCQN